MKNKTVILLFSLIAFVSICFTACENQIINKWWVDKTEPEEQEYVPLVKIIPINYDTVIEDKTVYQTVFVKLPPQTVYETVYVDKPVYQIVYEQLPPEIIYKTVEVVKTVYQDVIKYLPTAPDENSIIEWLKDPANADDTKEIIKKIKELYPDQFIDYVYVQVPPEIIYQEVEKIKTEYVTVYQDVIKYINVPTPPDKDTIIQWLKDPANEDDAKEIIKIIKEQYPNDFIDYIYVQLPPETIYKEVEVIKTVYQDVVQYIPTPPDKESIIKWLKDPENANDTKEIIKEIKELIPEEVLKEIIKEIPPKDIMDYLTDEQIKYIVSQQPAKKILQSIKIIGIEYIVFAGDSDKVNGPHGPKASTNLTAQETAYNTSSIKEMAKLLMDNPTYLLMLHGHANPTEFTDGETLVLETLSLNRANDVRRVLLEEYNNLPVNPANNLKFDDRVSCSGYGGEKTLFGDNTQYTPLNRRVEMILFDIVTTEE